MRLLASISVTILLTWLCLFEAKGQGEILQQQHYGIENGLPHREVNAICESRDGFIWVGTREGLCRFDGYEFVIYPAALPEESLVIISAEGAEWLSQLELETNNHLRQFNFNADFLAAEMNLSARHLQRQIKRTTGLTTNQYIQEAKLQQAQELLESGKVLVKQAAAQVGFKDVKHFTGLYKARFGKLPSEA